MTALSTLNINDSSLLLTVSPLRKRPRESCSQEGTPVRERISQSCTTDSGPMNGPITPSPVKKFEEILGREGVGTPSSVDALRRAGRCLLNRLNPDSPPEAKKGDELVTRLFEEVLPPNTHQAPDDFLKACQQNIKLLKGVPGLGPELSHLQTVGFAFNPASPNRTPVNLPHLLRSESVATGWHILKPEEADQLEGKVVSSMGVILGGFRSSEEGSPLKYSTFFPTDIIDSARACDDLVRRNHPILTNAERMLFHDQSTNLWCEGVYNEAGFLPTFYPLFFVAAYQEGVSYEIVKGGPAVSSDKVLKGAQWLLRDAEKQKLLYGAPRHPLRYQGKDPITGEQVVYIDLGRALARVFDRCIRGTLFKFPKELVKPSGGDPSKALVERSHR